MKRALCDVMYELDTCILTDILLCYAALYHTVLQHIILYVCNISFYVVVLYYNMFFLSYVCCNSTYSLCIRLYSFVKYYMTCVCILDVTLHTVCSVVVILHAVLYEVL